MRVQYLCLALFAALYSTHSAAVSLGQDGPTEHRLLRAEAPNASGGQEGADNGMGEERALFQAFEGFGARIGKTIGKVRPKSDEQSKILKAALKREQAEKDFYEAKVAENRKSFASALTPYTQRDDALDAVMKLEKWLPPKVLADKNTYRQWVKNVATKLKDDEAARKAAVEAANEAAEKAAKEAAAKAH
uniref:RxLR effector protein n=1 Tax=Peronospora matthiolae TaxID=2874970 RepID=A0AAV1UVK3_9STRA